MEKKEAKQKLESIKVAGHKIRRGVCSCLTARIRSRKFDMHLRAVFIDSKDDFNVSITEDKILSMIDEAESWDVMITEKKEVVLEIMTKEYQIWIDIPTPSWMLGAKR